MHIEASIGSVGYKNSEENHQFGRDALLKRSFKGLVWTLIKLQNLRVVGSPCGKRQLDDKTRMFNS